MDSIQLVILFIIFCLVYLWTTRSVPSIPAMLPPPALPPGGSYIPDYRGTNCSPADQDLMKNCQLIYSNCIQRSLEGKADFPTCHKDFMRDCMPVIRRCQMPAEEDT